MKNQDYIDEKLRRTKIRKAKRKEKRLRKKDMYNRLNGYKCRGCGEDPYCYCGDGTPYSY